MTWFEFIPVFATVVALLIGIGAPIAGAVGLRGIAFIGVAIGSSVASIGLSSVIAPWIGLSWTVFAPLGFSILVALALLLLRRRLTIAPRPGGRNEWGRPFLAQLFGVLLGSTLALAWIAPQIGDPGHPAQTYDTVFHLNAVEWILDTGNASPTAMTMTTPGRTTGFYPTLWHAIVAIVVQLTGASIPVATNAVALVVASVVWSVACVFFARVLFGRAPFHAVLVGGLSAVFGAFPALLLRFGVLYPNLLAVSLLPIALALLAALVQGRPRLGMRPVALALAAAFVIAGLTLAHPNALFSLFVLTVPLVVDAVVRIVRRSAPERRVRTALISATGAAALFAVEAFAFSRATTSDNGWMPSRSFPAAVREALTNSPLDLDYAWVVSALMLIGLVVAIRRPRLRWAVAAYLLSVLLYSVAIAWPAGDLRTAITGTWYNDSYRLAALTPVLAIPFAALGAVRVARWLVRGVRLGRDRSRRTAGLRPLATMIIVGALAIGVPYATTVIDSSRVIADRYRLDDASMMVSDREAAFFERIPELVPEDAVIAGNPWNGSSLVYAYTGLRTVFPHVGGAYPGGYWALADGLAEATPEACESARDLGVTHVLDFGDQYIFEEDERAEKYPGLTELREGPGLRLIAADGELALYKVVCD
ncbi:DUF6541 family protein [Agromyces italicus]|uniref:DUF6541 family protein n=1 Tax=Agromyces italicus TaxID=279572 RepID=UPI0003B68EA9|nr:DUF6541 family protein [Agromyces italicus]